MTLEIIAIEEQENRNLRCKIWKKFEQIKPFWFLTYFFENYTFFDSLQSFTDSDLILMSQIAGG